MLSNHISMICGLASIGAPAGSGIRAPGYIIDMGVTI